MAEKQTIEQKGVWFHMRGGPYDDCVFRLFPQRYPGQEKDMHGIGLDELPLHDGRYVRPHDSDPFMKMPAKPGKKRNNIPWMDWSEDLPILPLM